MASFSKHISRARNIPTTDYFSTRVLEEHAFHHVSCGNIIPIPPELIGSRIGADFIPIWPFEPPEPTSTCTSQTASDCTEFVSYGLNTKGSTTTSTTATECVILTGCSVTATTTTTATTSSCTIFNTCSVTTSCPNFIKRIVKRVPCSIGTTCSQTSLNCPLQYKPYVVWPADQASVPLIQELFADKFKLPIDSIHTATSINFGLNYWEVSLNASQVGDLQYNPLVGHLTAQY